MFVGKYEKGIRRQKIWNEKEERILVFKARYYRKFQNTYYPNISSKGEIYEPSNITFAIHLFIDILKIISIISWF